MKQPFKTASIFFLAFALMLSGACSNPKEKEEKEVSLYERGLEAISIMKEMAGNDEFISLFTVDAELRSILQEAGQGDFSQPAAVYRIRFPKAAFLSSLLDFAETDLENLSPSLEESLKSKAFSSVFTQINARFGGNNALAASSICIAERIFVYDGMKENEIYLYTYENAVPVAVTFLKGENGAVSATGRFVFYDNSKADTSDKDIIELLTVFGANIEEITE